jgi:hypothetical protein
MISSSLAVAHTMGDKMSYATTTETELSGCSLDAAGAGCGLEAGSDRCELVACEVV